MPVSFLALSKAIRGKISPRQKAALRLLIHAALRGGWLSQPEAAVLRERLGTVIIKG